MKTDLSDLNAFVAVARAGGFRDAARQSGSSASGLSEAVRRLEGRLGVRLLNRTTRSVAPTEAGARLLERLAPALREVESALDVMNGFRETWPEPCGSTAGQRGAAGPAADRPSLPSLPCRLSGLEVITEENFVDVLAAGCDAGIRYEERLEQDMIAVPIGPRVQRFAVAASPAYLDRHGRPEHPRDLLGHACLRERFPSGAMPPWEFERDGEEIRIDQTGPLVVTAGGASDFAVDAAVAGLGIVGLFEEWLRPHFESGALEPVLEPWWERFSGPFLYYPGRRLVPAPLRAFIDFIKASTAET
jgi:DNA-binding transcriptional LysR family regulator